MLKLAGLWGCGAGARSGAIGNEQVSWIETTVDGKGSISFWWKADCEWDEWGGASFDHLAFYVDGVELARLDGTTDWKQVSLALTKGEHTVRWAYEKDDELSEGEDCGWLDGVTWTPEEEPLVEPGGKTDYSPVGWTKPIAVSNDWLIAKGLVKPGDSATEAQVKLTETGANGLKRYESYILGMEPDSVEPAEEQLKVTIEGFDDDGLPIIKYSPKPNDATRVKYTTLGKSELKAVDWVEVTDLNKYLMRFYRTKAEIVP